MIRRILSLSLTLALCSAVGRTLHAQQRTDSLRQVDTAQATAALRAPITPRRAFLYSFLAPGYSQTVLHRNKAAAAFLLAEAISLAMIRESAADVHEARRSLNDSVIVSYVDVGGGAGVVKTVPRFTDNEVRTRRAHIEDWIAFLVANHLFAGADAFVAAHLWDVDTRLGLHVAPQRGGGAVVGAALKW